MMVNWRCQKLWNCAAASALQVYRHCPCKEDSAGLVMLQDIPKVSWSRTFFWPHHFARGADELEASWSHGQPPSRHLEPLSEPRVFGHVRWRKDLIKVSSELAQDLRTWSASVQDVVNSISDDSWTRPGWMPTQVKVGSYVEEKAWYHSSNRKSSIRTIKKRNSWAGSLNLIHFNKEFNQFQWQSISMLWAWT